jgi:hypothetical protein
MKDDTTPRAPFVPPALQWIIDETRRPQSSDETEVDRLLVLGRITFGEYIATLQEARLRH